MCWFLFAGLYNMLEQNPLVFIFIFYERMTLVKQLLEKVATVKTRSFLQIVA